MLAAGLGLAAGTPGAGAAGSDGAPPLVTTLQKVADNVGDAVDLATSGLTGSDRADITGASVEWAGGWIRMKVQVKNPTDPLKDPAWSDKSDAEWSLDTNGDGKEDYTVEFATDKGELYGAVFDATKPDDKSKCDADSASYSPQDGYTLVIDPACIGNPTTLGYAVAMFFDTNPKDDKDPMATDRVPDQGFVPAAAPGQPAAPPAPAPAPPGAAPTAAAHAPGAAPGPGARPGPARPGGPGGAPRSAASATPPSRPAAPAVTTPAPTAGPAPAAAGATPPPSGLARTGASSAKQGLFGLGIMLLGFGVVVMTRPRRPGLARP